MFLNIPSYHRYEDFAAFTPGTQIYNPGTGGPQSHMGLQAMQPRIYPTIYAIGVPGIGAMPRQVIGPTAPIVSNQLSTPDTVSQLEIRGLFKRPIGR
jgi:hypothetical protein